MESKNSIKMRRHLFSERPAGGPFEHVSSWQRYFFYFLFAAFMGFIYENLLDNLWYHHPWQWQGPLHGPWLVIYGLGGVVLLAMLQRFVGKRIAVGPLNITPVLTLVLIFVIVCVIEYTGHWFLDTFFNFRPWDYTEKPLNLNGRICLEDSLRFVVLGMLELYVFMPLIDRLLSRLSRRQSLITFTAAIGLFALDVVVSFIIMMS
jgi:uncharacterized membrane protein